MSRISMAPIHPRPLRLRRAVPALAAAAALLALAACQIAPPADQKALVKGYADYDAHHYTQAIAVANDYAAHYPQDPHRDEALYLRGLSEMALQQTVQARNDLAAAAQISTHPAVKGKSQRALGDLAYDDERFADAAALYTQALVEAPALLNEVAVNYRLGSALQAIGQWSRAVAPLERAAADAGDPDLATRAAERINATFFALQFDASHNATAASAYAVKLLGAGVPARTVTETRHGQRLYAVRSGHFNTYQDATAARDRLLPRYPLITIVPG